MAEGGNLKILQDSLSKARKYCDDKNYGRSFAHYLVVFQLLPPEARNAYENEFTTVLNFWGSILHSRQKYEDVFRCYHLATTYFPLSVEILNNLGVHALKLRNFTTAKTYFENVLNIDKNFLPAEHNLQTSKYALVDRWHFPMLNDVKRNKSYAQAIFMEISHGFSNILDVGTGTSLLSLFASKSKQCKSIVACDYSETMFEIANKVITANNAINIQLIQKSSNCLVVPKDFKKRATLLVTEILDSGIFGENILATLIYAWDNLLIPFPYGKVIPAGVAIYVTGIQSPELSRKIRLNPQPANLLKLNEICLTYSTVPYDTENLRDAKLTYMTETQMALYVNFNNVHQLKILNDSKDNNPIVQLKCKNTGKVDAFVIWFTLYLNETVTISNDPNSEFSSCWDQAVLYLRHPIPVEENENLNVKLSCYEGYVEIECAQTQNVVNDTHKDETNCFLVPKSIIYLLNDPQLMQNMEEISEIFADKFPNMNQISVLDICPFPVLGLLLAKHGARLACRVKQHSVELAIKLVCDLNEIDLKKVRIIHANDFNDFTNSSSEFDVVVQSLISPCGLLCEEEMYQAQVLRMSLSCRGVYLPNNVLIWAQLVECDWLEQATKVDDKNVCGFKIAQFVNEYKSMEQRDMNFTTVPHKVLSEVVNVGFVKHNVITAEMSKTSAGIVENGRANAIFYWFEVELFPGKRVSTLREESFVNNAAFMLEAPLSVAQGSDVCLVFKQHKGILKIFVE